MVEAILHGPTGPAETPGQAAWKAVQAGPMTEVVPPSTLDSIATLAFVSWLHGGNRFLVAFAVSLTHAVYWSTVAVQVPPGAIAIEQVAVGEPASNVTPASGGMDL